MYKLHNDYGVFTVYILIKCVVLYKSHSESCGGIKNCQKKEKKST